METRGTRSRVLMASSVAMLVVAIGVLASANARG